jgi:acyl transferase domain-containing protein
MVYWKSLTAVGTPAGDPKEASAVVAAMQPSQNRTGSLYIGSVKTNIGHVEGAAGLAGLVKAVYSLERGQIVPSLWFEKANEAIPLDEWALQVCNSQYLSTWVSETFLVRLVDS